MNSVLRHLCLAVCAIFLSRGEKNLLPILARRYREALNLAKSSSNPLTFEGSLSKGERFQHPFGEMVVFVLEPLPDGWEIAIKEHGRDEKLARLTQPFHFVPNPRHIEGWHLSKNPSACRTREYLADACPANQKEFIFSLEVGKSIDASKLGCAVEIQELKDIQLFGRRMLTIREFKLQPTADACPLIEWIRFSVQAYFLPAKIQARCRGDSFDRSSRCLSAVLCDVVASVNIVLETHARTLCLELIDEDIKKMSDTYHAWRGERED